MKHGHMRMERHGHDHQKMLVDEHLSSLWPHYANIVLGLWLITSPFALGYMSDYVPDANAQLWTVTHGAWVALVASLASGTGVAVLMLAAWR